MGLSKLNIIKQVCRSYLGRKIHSSKPSKSDVRTWRKNLGKSPFYKSFEDLPLSSFPIVNKQIFMDHFDAINTVGISKKEALSMAHKAEVTRDFGANIGDISIGLSSGTSGNKGIFLTNQKERETWVGAVVDRVIGFSTKRRSVAFFLRANNNLYEATNSNLLKFNFFDLQQDIRSLYLQFLSLNPNILIAQPSVLLRIAQFVKADNVSLELEKVISVAEVLEDDVKVYLQSIFKTNIDQVYQCTEGFLAHTCSKGQLHFNEDWLLIEKKYLDEDKTRFHPIITDYRRMSQPVIRYELNDIIHEGLPCSCGLKSTVIDKIEGRSDDVFKFDKGGRQIIIFPDFIRRAIINVSDDIINYQVIKLDDHCISLYIHSQGLNASIFDDAKDALTNIFVQRGVNGISIIKGEYNESFMTKFKRISDESK